MGLSRKLVATKYEDKRRVDLDKSEAGREPPHGAAALALHMASKAHRGPSGTTTPRVSMRAKHGYDGAAKIIRGAFDRAEKRKRK